MRRGGKRSWSKALPPVSRRSACFCCCLREVFFLMFSWAQKYWRETHLLDPLPPPLLPLPSQAATKGRHYHASSATANSAQAWTAVPAAWQCSGLRRGTVAAGSRMPSLKPDFCVVLVCKPNLCYTWHRKGPSLPEFRPEFRISEDSRTN